MQNTKKLVWVWAVVAVIIIVAVIWGISRGGSENSDMASTTLGQNSTSTSGLIGSTTNPSIFSSSTNSLVPAKPVLLQDNPFVNSEAKFSIFLPKRWGVQDSATSSTVSNTWFHDIGVKKEDTAITMVVGRFERTNKMNETIGARGGEVFLDMIAKGLSSDLYKYTLNSTSTVNINGVTFRKYYGSYLGINSGKQVTQSIYLTLSDKAYYMIGVDSYTEEWEANREKMMASVSTFRLLP